MKTDFVLYNLREILKKFPENANVCFAGGCVRDMLSGDKIKDYDLFCADKQSEDQILDFLRATPTKVLNESAALSNFIYDDKLVQVIRGRYNTTWLNLINSFDYTICCAAVSKTEFLHHDKFFEDCLTKSLRINQITFPLSTLERLQKYIKKGYSACNGTLLEIAKSLSGLQLERLSDSDINNTLRFYPDGTPRFLGVD